MSHLRHFAVASVVAAGAAAIAGSVAAQTAPPGVPTCPSGPIAGHVSSDTGRMAGSARLTCDYLGIGDAAGRSLRVDATDLAMTPYLSGIGAEGVAAETARRDGWTILTFADPSGPRAGAWRVGSRLNLFVSVPSDPGANAAPSDAVLTAVAEAFSAIAGSAPAGGPAPPPFPRLTPGTPPRVVEPPATRGPPPSPPPPPPASGGPRRVDTPPSGQPDPPRPTPRPPG